MPNFGSYDLHTQLLYTPLGVSLLVYVLVFLGQPVSIKAGPTLGQLCSFFLGNYVFNSPSKDFDAVVLPRENIIYPTLLFLRALAPRKILLLLLDLIAAMQRAVWEEA